MPQVIKDAEVKARKEHKCMLCNGEISKGEVYAKQTNKDGGRIYDFVAHSDCMKISSALWRFLDPWEGLSEDVYQDGVTSYASEHICESCDNWNDEYGCKKNLIVYKDCRTKIRERLDNYKFIFDKVNLQWIELSK